MCPGITWDMCWTCVRHLRSGMHLHAIGGCERTPRCTSLRPSFHFASSASEAVWGSSVVGRVQALHTRHACTHKPQPEHTGMKTACRFAVFRRQQVTLCEYLLCAAETKVKPRFALRWRSVRNSMFPRQPIISNILGFAPHFCVATLRTCTPTCTCALRTCMHALSSSSSSSSLIIIIIAPRLLGCTEIRAGYMYCSIIRFVADTEQTFYREGSTCHIVTKICFLILFTKWERNQGSFHIGS